MTSRAISGRQLSASNNSVSQETVANPSSPPLSPFTAAFLDQTEDTSTQIQLPNQSIEDSLSKTYDNTDNNLSIDSFQKSILRNKMKKLRASSKERAKEVNDDIGMHWTRTRVKSLESQIRSLTQADSVGSTRAINLSNEMLSKAKFIGQVDAKFIIVDMEGIICALDQHAADERVGLDRLEKALFAKMNSSGKDKAVQMISINLSKRHNICLDDLMKFVQLKEPRILSLSSSQYHVIMEHKDLISKWKFTFTVNESSTELTLVSTPRIFDRVATAHDFIQYTQALGYRTSDASLVQPAFVKRALASYACRYSIMFGEILSEETCKNLIQSLSKCDMSFVCAHGRPSIVPLIDLNTVYPGEM
mmetsp:Transcript_25133/g.29090  ORF Transcript_25133/g.29090 Transcript_25133/m.29090 type:complete len:362 (-) Transcript_25133:111-1196(-)